MKPFNLEEARYGAKVVTRDGRLVTQLIKFNADEEKTLYGVVNNEIASWKDDGKFAENNHILDLFMRVEPIRRWVNVYYDNATLCVGGVAYSSKKEAESNRDNDLMYIKTIEINDIV